LEQVALGKYDFDNEVWEPVSEEAKKFIKKLLEMDVNSRYSAEQALHDPWLLKMTSDEHADKAVALKALKHLKSFRADSKLQEAVWMYLVNYVASCEEKTNLLKTFEDLDENHDGQLSREELISGYKKIMGNNADVEKEVDIIMCKVDTNHSGAIDYSEFVMAAINRQQVLSKENLDTVFKIFDKDGDGYLDVKEIREIFNGNAKMKIEESVWIEMINEVDHIADGKISLTEFRDMMLTSSNKQF